MDGLGKNLKFMPFPSRFLQQVFHGWLSRHQQDATAGKTLVQGHGKVDSIHVRKHDIDDR